MKIDKRELSETKLRILIDKCEKVCRISSFQISSIADDELEQVAIKKLERTKEHITKVLSYMKEDSLITISPLSYKVKQEG